MAALAGLLALTGCAELGYANGRYGDYGDYRRAPGQETACNPNWPCDKNAGP